ncbi:DUF11 domain-containing protein [Longimicrobium terrae]|uniref:Putative repeat protein (TIGR01451 family) n=1 Tax=Longimicrobium terrae TaxID=1639882 RepID=A0A841H3D5_9BACT|nr:DUF11 domain-containing protein [Longimicrobium terrae]MBB4638311.1 putative repeat protein (TIGR01451 family) [Longimicrobium terrae]MBB6072621.1 putative repeat protein (TIGR01451 family) [Longimicrobium terrae]NNC28600.1 DUF11 domain-containing protein [Longimicrobium terrae]
MKTLRRAALAALLLAPVALVKPASAQLTPEGTVITNTATASWTDANNNTYANVTASASVTVGYLANPDVASPATVTPASPSTGNELPFTITNSGNGVDSVTVATTAGTGVTITGYKLGSTTYPTLAALNAALAVTSVPANGTVTVTVVYTVAPGRGGQTTPVTLTATSRRVTTTSDASTTNVIPPVAGGAGTTVEGGASSNATVYRLPSNGTGYSATYTLTNTGNASDTYSLVPASSNGAVVTLGTMTGTGVSGGQVTIPAGGSVTITVNYTVSQVPAGSTSNITLTSTSGNNSAVTTTGTVTVIVIRAALTMTKQAFRDNQTTAVSGTVLPGEYIWYRITVTNAGGAAAATVAVSDPLPSQVTYVSTATDAAGWTITETSGTVSASLTGTLAPAASRYFWIRVRVK